MLRRGGYRRNVLCMHARCTHVVFRNPKFTHGPPSHFTHPHSHELPTTFSISHSTPTILPHYTMASARPIAHARASHPGIDRSTDPLPPITSCTDTCSRQGVTTSTGIPAPAMNSKTTLSQTSPLWDRFVQICSRRDVLVASVVGLCGVGIFWGVGRFLAITPFEKQVLQDHGTTLFPSHIAHDGQPTRSIFCSIRLWRTLTDVSYECFIRRIRC
jgi:hypothetical protein